MDHRMYTEQTRPHQILVSVVLEGRVNNVKISNAKVSNNQSANSLTRKSSSVRNNRGRKYTIHPDENAKQQYFGEARKGGTNTSHYLTNPNGSYITADGNANVNRTINYYTQNSKILPRSKTNSRKRDAVIKKVMDSRNVPANITPGGIRPNRSSIKRTPVAYANMQGRTKSTNNRSTLKDRIKTIEYHDANFNSLVNRSSTAQKRKRAQDKNNFDTNDSSSKPYSNFIPSTNTRSNITIDRSSSLGYGKLGIQNQNPSSIPSITNKKSNSKKLIAPINEYEDDSTITLNSNNFVKRSNLNTIVGIKNTD